MRCAGSTARLVAASLVVLACRGEAEEARRAEAGRVARAVELLREAPGEGKRPLLAALKQVACSAEDVCQLKQRCLDAYGVHAGAVEALAAVRRELQGASGASPASGELLRRAESDLERASALARECADLEGAARRAYRL